MTDTIAKIPTLPECITIFIAGPVASGKSFLIKRFVEKMPRSLILDAGADYLDPSYEHIWYNPQALAQRLEENPFYYRIAYHPDSDHFQEEFHWCFAGIWSVNQPRYFVIEESHEVCANNAMHPDIKTILRYSRHNFLGVIASSQRIADVDKLLTGMARMVILFRTDEFRDIEATRQRWGPEAAQALTKLRPCIYNDATKECEQEPECLVYVRGRGFKVVSLGNKVKPVTGENELWQDTAEPQEPQSPEVLFSEGSSGEQIQKSPESTSEVS